ncbi:unnamed protein product [Eruca vesicaria subsp. sativa]|uniref:Uncharacterized protein n=1 Tax=Eruca vesicaria subsp. sativa TaxID=29727 RepID=A0ABC8K687_ERUVS|nr:unnamed protein product [Eruca vesicaria subsp. sativa]
MFAVSLISSARVVAKLDSKYTAYSAQFLVDNAGRKNEPSPDPQPSSFTIQDCLAYLVDIATPKPESEQREVDERRNTLTLKDCLEYAMKEGLPKHEHWTHVGCVHKPPPFASLIPRVPMNGELIEAKTPEEAFELLRKQPVGAKLHVFSPEFDRVRDEGFYEGPSGPESRYVGLRDVMISGGTLKEAYFEVKIVYKKKETFLKVSLTRMLTSLPNDSGEESQLAEPTGLLVDFIVPRFSK